MSPETHRLILDIIRPGISLAEAQLAYMTYVEHLKQNPVEAALVLQFAGPLQYDVPFDEEEQARQADVELAEREELERTINENSRYVSDAPVSRPFTGGVDFKKAAQTPPPSRDVAPAGSAFYDDSLTPAQADLLQKGRDMRLPFGKFGPKGVKGYKSIYEIWLEEPTYLDWVFDNVDRLTPLQELVIGFYRYYKGSGRKQAVASGYVPFPGT